MSLSFDSEIRPEFLRITATGEYSFDFLFDFIASVKAEADNVGRNRVLIDCRQVTGGMAEFERFHGGKRIAEVFGGRLRAALLMQPQNITKLGELAAVNRGAKFLVSGSETEAIDWLLEVGHISN
jgi:hypothetical protein